MLILPAQKRVPTAQKNLLNRGPALSHFVSPSPSISISFAFSALLALVRIPLFLFDPSQTRPLTFILSRRERLRGSDQFPLLFEVNGVNIEGSDLPAPVLKLSFEILLWPALRECVLRMCLPGSPSDLNTGNGTEGTMVCTSLGSLLRPLFYFLCSNLKANPVQSEAATSGQTKREFLISYET